jgi:mRNA interferase RelE/StbE
MKPARILGLSDQPPWQVIITPRAERDIQRLPIEQRRQIEEGILTFALELRGDVKKLAGGAGWRLRIGVWRVIFDRLPSARQILITRVRHRREAYRD